MYRFRSSSQLGMKYYVAKSPISHVFLEQGHVLIKSIDEEDNDGDRDNVVDDDDDDDDVDDHDHDYDDNVDDEDNEEEGVEKEYLHSAFPVLGNN